MNAKREFGRDSGGSSVGTGPIGPKAFSEAREDRLRLLEDRPVFLFRLAHCHDLLIFRVVSVGLAVPRTPEKGSSKTQF